MDTRKKWTHVVIIFLVTEISIFNSCYSSIASAQSVQARRWQETQIEPQQYTQLYRLACKPNRTLQSIAEQKEHRQLIEEFKRSSGCERAPEAWRWRYLDEEIDDKWVILLREHTVNERLANVIYTTGLTKIFDIDSFTFNSGDNERDLLNMELVAGDKVDDEECGHQLNKMLNLMDELRLLNENYIFNHSNEDSRNTRGSLEEKYLRLAKVLDSFGRYESNHLTGRMISFGSFDQCRRGRLLMPTATGTTTTGGHDDKRNEYELKNMRFCWARHRLDSFLDESLHLRRKVAFEINSTVLISGICIPEACHSRSFPKFKHLLRRIVSSEFRLPRSIYHNETLELDSIFCLVDEASQIAMIPPIGKLIVLCSLIYLALVSLVTWTKFLRVKEQPLPVFHQLNGENPPIALAPLKNKPREESGRYLAAICEHLKALDLKDSWKDFIRNDDAGHKENRVIDLDTINPIKVLGCAYVVLGHSVLLWAGMMMNEISALQSYENHPFILLILGGTTVVDTFFVISGILTSYLALKRLNCRRQKRLTKQEVSLTIDQVDFKNHQSIEMVQSHDVPAQNDVKKPSESRYGIQAGIRLMKSWLFLSSLRYLRVVPLFAIVYYFKRYVLIYLGNGPMWDYGLNKDTPIGACKLEPWYVPFTPLSAYYSLTKQCLLQSWSLSNEIVFSLISPPLILLMNVRPKLASFIVAIMTLASAAQSHLAFEQVRPELYFEIFDARAYSFTRIINEYSYIYTSPTYRIFSIFVGTVGGYVLFRHSKKVQKERPRQAQLDQTTSSRKIFPAHFSWLATRLAFFFVSLNFVLWVYARQLKSFFFPNHGFIIPVALGWSRIFWAIATLVIFLRMMTDWKDHALLRFSSSAFWKILSRLIFAILLVHLDLLAYMHLSSWKVSNGSLLNAAIEACGVYLICLPIGVFIYVVVENPISKLINQLLFKRAKTT